MLYNKNCKIFFHYGLSIFFYYFISRIKLATFCLNASLKSRQALHQTSHGHHASSKVDHKSSQSLELILAYYIFHGNVLKRKYHNYFWSKRCKFGLPEGQCSELTKWLIVLEPSFEVILGIFFPIFLRSNAGQRPRHTTLPKNHI